MNINFLKKYFAIGIIILLFIGTSTVNGINNQNNEKYEKIPGMPPITFYFSGFFELECYGVTHCNYLTVSAGTLITFYLGTQIYTFNDNTNEVKAKLKITSLGTTYN